jgi:hypothetical protein
MGADSAAHFYLAPCAVGADGSPRLLDQAGKKEFVYSLI